MAPRALLVLGLVLLVLSGGRASGLFSSDAPPAPDAQLAEGTSGAHARSPSLVFSSPSGNINCLLTNASGTATARCEILERTWEAPAAPPDCPAGWGSSFAVTQVAALTCSPVDLVPGRSLAYGSSWSLRQTVCTSEVDGITCRTDAGHGFRVSRSSYEVF